MLMRDLKYIDKLPTDTIILQENGVAAQKSGKGWEFAGCTGVNPTFALRLPIEVIHTPILKTAATLESITTCPGAKVSRFRSSFIRLSSP